MSYKSGDRGQQMKDTSLPILLVAAQPLAILDMD